VVFSTGLCNRIVSLITALIYVICLICSADGRTSEEASPRISIASCRARSCNAYSALISVPACVCVCVVDLLD
jgi:hypothetical protein